MEREKRGRIESADGESPKKSPRGDSEDTKEEVGLSSSDRLRFLTYD
jgi:hypothetical protein